MWYNWGMNGMWMNWIFWLVIIGLIIWLILTSGKRNYPEKNIPFDNETPLDILKKRYAKGEINKEQFEQMRKDLSN